MNARLNHTHILHSQLWVTPLNRSYIFTLILFLETTCGSKDKGKHLGRRRDSQHIAVLPASKSHDSFILIAKLKCVLLVRFFRLRG